MSKFERVNGVKSFAGMSSVRDWAISDSVVEYNKRVNAEEHALEVVAKAFEAKKARVNEELADAWSRLKSLGVVA